MTSVENIIGEICKIVLPIPEESYLGNNTSSVAICTLSSIKLLKNIANSDLLHHVSLVGRLLTENKGIDAIVKYSNQNKNLKTIIICGKEVWGHKAGHSLLQLHKNGIDVYGKIIGSTSPDPYLSVSEDEVHFFQHNIKLINLINETELDVIKQKIF